MEKFTIGLIVGGIGGVLLTANSYRMRMLVKKSQDEVQRKLDDIMDDKLDDLEENAKKAKEKVMEKAEDVKEKITEKTQKRAPVRRKQPAQIAVKNAE